RAAGSVAGDIELRTCRAQAHRLERHAELARYELRERGFVPLAVVVGGRIERERAVGGVFVELPAQLDLVLGREPGTGGLDVGRQAAAAKPATFFRFFLSSRKSVPVCGLERLLQDPGEVAAVVLEAGGDTVRKALFRDEALAAQLGRVDAE